MTLAVLSWKAHETLIQTLESYKKWGLDDEQKVIFFQEISQEDKDIAQRYGYDAIGDSKNIGIGPAYAELVRYAKGEFFCFLENDWLLIEPPERQISAAKELLKIKIDVVRLRHRKNPGNPLWTRQFKDNELSRPEHLLDSIHWTDPYQFEGIGLTSIYTEDFSELDIFYLASAKNANWTNNPTMFRTEWLRENIVPRLSGNVEKAIQPWWQTQNFTVAQGEGLFTHMRID